MIVCVAGNPSIDRLIEVEALAPGEIHRPSSLVVLPGGKGLHVARVSAVLGSPATATGILAGHAGRWISEALAREGVLGRFAWGPGETRSCLSVSDRATGALTEFYEPGTPGTAQAWSDLVGIVASMLNSTRWLVLSGSLPPGTPVDGYAQLIARAAAARGACGGRFAGTVAGGGPGRRTGAGQDQRLRSVGASRGTRARR